MHITEKIFYNKRDITAALLFSNLMSEIAFNFMQEGQGFKKKSGTH